MAVESITMSTDEGSVTLTPEQFERATASVGLTPPSEAAFGEDDFLTAPGIEALAEQLFGKDLRFAHLSHFSVEYLWKKSGGKRNGKAVYGKTQKPTGLLRHFARVDFAIWLAADHCRESGYGPREIEALLFHELLHVGYAEDEETGERTASVWPHDFEGFRAEIETYGFWDADLRGLQRTVEQLPLFGQGQ